MGSAFCCCRQKEGPDIAISNRSSCPMICDSNCHDKCGSILCCVIINQRKASPSPQVSERTISPLEPRDKI